MSRNHKSDWGRRKRGNKSWARFSKRLMEFGSPTPEQQLAVWTKELQKTQPKGAANSTRGANATLNVANLLDALGRHQEELPLREQYLDACRKNLGPDHLDTVQAEWRLASCLVHLERPEEADPLLQHVVQVRTSEHGPMSSDTMLAISLSAKVAKRLGRFEEARELHLRALAWFESQDEVKPAQVAGMAMATGQLLSEWHEYGEALEFYRRAFEIRRRDLGPDDPSTLTSQRWLALTTYQTGQVDAARGLAEDVVEKCERTLGPDAQQTTQAKQLLANIERDS